MLAKDGVKQCSRCCRQLAVELFYRNRSTPDGLNANCKECFRRYSKPPEQRPALDNGGRCGRPKLDVSEPMFCKCGCGAELPEQLKRRIKTPRYRLNLKEVGFLVGHCNRGARHRNYKDGRGRDGNGYARIRNAAGVYVHEHRAIMEAILGRPLKTDEHVHHINGVRDDNRLENLQVMPASEHKKLPHKT